MVIAKVMVASHTFQIDFLVSHIRKFRSGSDSHYLVDKHVSKSELEKLRPVFYDIDKERPAWKDQLDDMTGYVKLRICEVYHWKNLCKN